MYDLIIIGAGPAGLTAGLYAGRRRMKTLILEAGPVGGQMNYAAEIENYPGIERTSGTELAHAMREQASEAGCEIKSENVVEANLNAPVKKIRTDAATYEAKTVILATGAAHRKLEIPDEDKFTGRGVSYCISCDAPFFRDKTTAVIGGSDSAIMAALLLEKYAKKVFLIHRRDELRAEHANQEKLRKSSVKVIWNAVVSKLEGDKKLEAVELKDVKTEKTSKLKLDGLFIYVGTTPTTLIAQKAGITIDDKQFIVTNNKQETNLPGVYAAGDCTGGILQVAQAVGQGATAATNAHLYSLKTKA